MVKPWKSSSVEIFTQIVFLGKGDPLKRYNFGSKPELLFKTSSGSRIPTILLQPTSSKEQDSDRVRDKYTTVSEVSIDSQQATHSTATAN